MEVSIWIAKQQRWQNSVRQEFLKDMMAAASEGVLTVYHPETEITRLPKFGPNCPNAFTTPEDVNKWLLNSKGARWKWILETPEPQAAPVVAVGASDSVEPVTGKRWTPENLADLKSYRDKHGTKKAAEFFRISEQRIRQKLPSEKPQPKGYSAFTHRMK
jgi:hypothetical protein